MWIIRQVGVVLSASVRAASSMGDGLGAGRAGGVSGDKEPLGKDWLNPLQNDTGVPSGT